MSKLSGFSEYFDEDEVRITEDGLISVLDAIAVFARVKNPSKTWGDLQRRHPEIANEIVMHQFQGRGQRETPVANNALLGRMLRLMGAHPETEFVMSDKFYPRAEIQITKVLTAAFYDCEPSPQFYCCGYRIDLYLAKQRIAIECDEHGHMQYNQARERQREKAIKTALGCSFVRFDPYDPAFNVGDVVAKIRRLVQETHSC